LAESEGAALAIIDRDADAAANAAAKITAAGHHAIPIACDVTDEDGVTSAMTEIADRFGGLDIW
jgi:NAD(P)-dependent dehydrogenase (short-subunit alcohol dehydrogenase family)